MKRKDFQMSIAVVGVTKAGKTSFLSALYGSALGRASGGAVWTVAAKDEDTSKYLKEGWYRLQDGQALEKTRPGVVQPPLQLELRRELDGRHTHTLDLTCLDLPGEYGLRDSAARQGVHWEQVVERIAKANVLLLVIDAMNVLYADEGPGHPSAVDYLAYNELWEAAALSGLGPAMKEKVLAVCLCKCDAVVEFKIDGIDDDLDAVGLAKRLLTENLMARDARRFGSVRYFALSVLQDFWRWDRAGACVLVGAHRPEPVGLFDPFEWICQP